jgi:hypothetical protein
MQWLDVDPEELTSEQWLRLWRTDLPVYLALKQRQAEREAARLAVSLRILRLIFQLLPLVNLAGWYGGNRKKTWHSFTPNSPPVARISQRFDSCNRNQRVYRSESCNGNQNLYFVVCSSTATTYYTLQTTCIVFTLSPRQLSTVGFVESVRRWLDAQTSPATNGRICPTLSRSTQSISYQHSRGTHPPG